MKRISRIFVDMDILDKQENEYVVYAFKLLSMSLLGICVAILIGFILKITNFTIVYLLFFIPLRIYAGGYHAKTRERCALFSLIILLCADLCFKNRIYKTISCKVLEFIFCVYIWHKAPMDTYNKRLSAKEKQFFRKKTKYILIVIQVFYVFSIIHCNDVLCGASSICVICTGIILYLQSIIERKSIFCK